jgi:hypothetical protein
MVDRAKPREVKIGRYTLPLPRSRIARIVIGVLLILGGIFSVLPILGIWMLPLGLLVLSVDIPRVRRWRRRFSVWFARRYPRLAAKLHPGGPANGTGTDAETGSGNGSGNGVYRRDRGGA